MHNNTVGASGERLARQHLQHNGLTVVVENFSCRHGEIDLIMQHAKLLIFVEVRLRNNCRFGAPEDTVQYRKQRKIIRTAQYFLQNHPQWRRFPCRFDVIAMRSEGELRWIQDAFQAPAW